jgi:hypothetical protein
MGKVYPKFGGRWWPVRQAGRRNVMVAKREKNERKKTKKNHFGPCGT